jgi:hypothetical protein
MNEPTYQSTSAPLPSLPSQHPSFAHIELDQQLQKPPILTSTLPKSYSAHVAIRAVFAFPATMSAWSYGKGKGRTDGIFPSLLSFFESLGRFLDLGVGALQLGLGFIKCVLFLSVIPGGNQGGRDRVGQGTYHCSGRRGE